MDEVPEIPRPRTRRGADLRRTCGYPPGSKVPASKGYLQKTGRCPPVLGSVRRGYPLTLARSSGSWKQNSRDSQLLLPRGLPFARAPSPAGLGVGSRSHATHNCFLRGDAPPGLTLKSHTATVLVDRVKGAVQSPPLCLRREWRLRHSPTVVAGSSMDCDCTRTKGPRDSVWCTA